MGGARADRVMRDACAKASLTVIDGTRPDEHGALVEHLRLRGDLTTGFLIRTIAHGKIDFFGSALVALTKQAESRVMSLLAGGSDVAVCALLRSAGLLQATHGVILRALKVWRDVAKGKRLAGAQEVTWLMLRGDRRAGRRGRDRRPAEVDPPRIAARQRARSCAGHRRGLTPSAQISSTSASANSAFSWMKRKRASALVPISESTAGLRVFLARRSRRP